MHRKQLLSCCKHHSEDSPLLSSSHAQISTLLTALRFDLIQLCLCGSHFYQSRLFSQCCWILLGEGGMDFSWSNQSSAMVCQVGLIWMFMHLVRNNCSNNEEQICNLFISYWVSKSQLGSVTWLDVNSNCCSLLIPKFPSPFLSTCACKGCPNGQLWRMRTTFEAEQASRLLTGYP